MRRKKISIIGAGFSGISAATTLAKEGHEVHAYEKNSLPGGRARNFSSQGFTFDMGPTWYWMPDIFEKYFSYFGKKVSDYYTLERVSPSYRTFFGTNDYIDLPSSLEEVCELFESLEEGSSKKLKKFLKDSEYKYDVGINKLVQKPAKSVTEFFDFSIMLSALKLDILKSMTSYIKRNFKHPRLIRLLEFPVIFLGATPKNTPALYSLMNYADISLGTWYPIGGMFSVVQGMVKLAEELGVKFHYNQPVKNLNINNKGKIVSIAVNGHLEDTDFIIGSADYNHIEMSLLPERMRNYSNDYWEKRDMAPSALLYYVGVNKPLKNLEHHNLFFDTDFDIHASEIYDKPQWPSDPALYVSCPSKTDKTIAPENHENLIILIPVAPGLKDTEEIREKYYDISIRRFEKLTNQKIKENIVFKRSYAQSNFIEDYNSFKGNAYGLANTLRQTAFLKPKIYNRKIKNLFYAGQLTTPGPGVPPTIISGQVAAREVIKTINAN